MTSVTAPPLRLRYPERQEVANMGEWDYTVRELARELSLRVADVEGAIARGELLASRRRSSVRVNVWQAAEWLSKRAMGS